MSLKSIFVKVLHNTIYTDYKVWQLNRNFKANCVNVLSPFVSPKARLGYRTRVDYGAVVTENVQLGRYSFVGVNSFVDMATIGQFVSIGRNVSIGGYEHPYSNLTTSPNVYRSILKRPDLYSDIAEKIKIGNDVWIGNNVCILGGVSIGDGAVVGAGAVVTKDVPDFGIVAGVPAKLLKYRFPKDMCTKILELHWWDWEESKILANKEYFLNIEKL